MDRGMQAENNAKRDWPWGTIFVFSAGRLYISFTIIGTPLFPKPVYALSTYLSMLGNADINPDG